MLLDDSASASECSGMGKRRAMIAAYVLAGEISKNCMPAASDRLREKGIRQLNYFRRSHSGAEGI